MLCYASRRLVQVVLMTFAFVTVTFLILQAMPGDVTQLYLNPDISPEARDAVRARFGLDQPVHVQYVRYMVNFIRGDLGYSFRHYPRPVWDIIMERLPRTFVLFFTATIAYFYIGFTLGKIIAWKRGSPIEYVATCGGVLLYTLFLPMYGLLVLWLFALRLGWFPIGQFITPRLWRLVDIGSNTIFGYVILNGAVAACIISAIYIVAARLVPYPHVRRAVLWGAVTVTVSASLLVWRQSGYAYLAWDIISHMVLPVFTLASAAFAGSMLLTRDSMLETVREDYVWAARAKGLPDRVVRDRHVARTALLPVVTSFTLAMAAVMNGGIITETIFSWPGMGLTLMSAIQTNDWPLALGTFTFTGIFVLVAHLVADLLHAVLDPRIRY